MNQETAIKQTIQNYLDGYLNAQKDTVALAFHPNTVLLSVAEQQLSRLDIPTWFNNMDERRSKGDIRQAQVEIKSLDITDRTAVAKLELTFAQARYTDYLSLLQLEDGWKIVGKIYSMRSIQ